MGVSFFETMQGELFDPWGRTVPMDFEVKVEAAPISGLLETGQARLTGVAHLPPYAEHAPLLGTLTLAPLLRRRLIYDFRFTDPAGDELHLHGEKHLRWTSPLRTMTTLHSVLRRGDQELARGVLRFDLHEALALAASIWPSTSLQRLSMIRPDPQVPTSTLLDARETGLLVSLCEAVISPGVHVPAADAVTARRTLRYVTSLPAPTPTAWKLALTGLDLAVRLRTGRSWVDLSLQQRQGLVRALSGPDQGAHSKPFRRLFDLLKTPILSAHFSRPDYLDSLGLPRPAPPAREPPPRYLQQVTAAEDLASETTLRAEVVVVGSGAGGGPLAATLAERGVAVVLLEEGRYHQRADFAGDPMDRMRRLYRDQGMTFTAGAPPISIPMGRAIGGTTTVNSGTCLRVPDHVLAQWRDEGLPEDFTPERFGRWYDKVEAEIGVGPSERRYLGAIADIVGRGADALGLAHGPLPRNAPGCDGQGTCILGCPTDAKRSSNVSWVPRALKAGAQAVTGLPVARVLMRGRRAVGVEARGTDMHGAPKLLRVQADAVVLACGTLLTPGLLMESGVKLPWLGRNLSLHPGMGMFVLCDDDIAPWDAVPQGYAVHGHGIEDVVFEGVYMPPHFAAPTFALDGAELTRWMDGHGRTGQFGFMVRDRGTGRVHRPIGGRAVIRYDLTERSRALLQRGAALLSELLLRGGGREVMTGFGGRPIVRSVAEARALGQHRAPAVDFNLLGAHPLGTCRMGGSARTGVVDPEHRVFGTDNLYVVDGSAVPSSLGVNPQITIMAMALRAGEALASRHG